MNIQKYTAFATGMVMAILPMQALAASSPDDSESAFAATPSYLSGLAPAEGGTFFSPTAPTPGAPAHYSLEFLFGAPANAPPPGSFEAAILNGTPWLDARYRFEDDSQDHIHRHAKASTLRTRLGYETGEFEHFKLGFEVQNVRDIGAEHFNNGINGKTLYPTVSDPEETALRQGYVDYDGAALYGTEIKAGRQLINLDNQRFIGQSDWRDLGNNFDAVSFNNTYLKDADFFYAYVRQANRGYGDHLPLGTLIGNTNLINASYQVAPQLKVVGYSYLIDAESNNPAINIYSTATYGIRLTGEQKAMDDLKFSYALEGANQKPYDDNPLRGYNDYYLIEPAASAYGVTAKLGYEMMQGNGIPISSSPSPGLNSRALKYDSKAVLYFINAFSRWRTSCVSP